METIKGLCAYYYLGLVIGYFRKQDIIEWADQVIEKHRDFPNEIIEVSLSGKKTIEDIASKLKYAYGKEEIVEPLYKLLGEMVIALDNGRISEESFFSYISSLHLQGTAFSLNEEISYLFDRLSDGYYLATEGIYGDVYSIRDEAINELSKYKRYVILYDEV